MDLDWGFTQDGKVMKMINSAARHVTGDLYLFDDAYQDLLVWMASHERPKDDQLLQWILYRRAERFAELATLREQLLTDEEWDVMGRD